MGGGGGGTLENLESNGYFFGRVSHKSGYIYIFFN